MPALTLTPSHQKSELRILDTDLATQLNFAVPRNIRKTIRRHESALKSLGSLGHMAQTSSAKGGRPGMVYYLNYDQALYVIVKSQQDVATDILLKVIKRFAAYENGSRLPLPVPAREALQIQNEMLTDRVKAAETKANAFDQLSGTEGLISLKVVGNHMGYRPAEFVSLLVSAGWIYERKGGELFANQKMLNAGFLVQKTRIRHGTEGNEQVSEPWFTAAGQAECQAQLGPLPEAGEFEHAPEWFRSAFDFWPTTLKGRRIEVVRRRLGAAARRGTVDGVALQSFLRCCMDFVLQSCEPTESNTVAAAEWEAALPLYDRAYTLLMAGEDTPEQTADIHAEIEGVPHSVSFQARSLFWVTKAVVSPWGDKSRFDQALSGVAWAAYSSAEAAFKASAAIKAAQSAAVEEMLGQLAAEIVKAADARLRLTHS